MKFLPAIILCSLCFAVNAQAQEIKMMRAVNVNQLKSQAAQIFRDYEDEFHKEAMSEFDKMDVNFDGYVSEDEFLATSGYGTSEQRSVVFRAMDKNHDGVLSKDEMWTFVKSRINAL